MKTIKVVAAAIIHDGKVLAAQRGYGDYKDGWEFPGGKVEQGESLQQALQREIYEEMDAMIEVEDLVGNVEYTYPEFHISMWCFFCKVDPGKLKLLEHEGVRWLDSEHLYNVNWLLADVKLLDKVEDRLKKENDKVEY